MNRQIPGTVSVISGKDPRHQVMKSVFVQLEVTDALGFHILEHTQLQVQCGLPKVCLWLLLALLLQPLFKGNFILSSCFPVLVGLPGECVEAQGSDLVDIACASDVGGWQE